jgi:hypothetical protein
VARADKIRHPDAMRPTPDAPTARPAFAALATLAVTIAALSVAGCANDGQNLYQPPPDDGSANANSSDVVTEPPVNPR